METLLLIRQYIAENFALLTILAGIFLITSFDVYLDRKMLASLRVALMLMFALIIFDAAEDYFSRLDHVTVFRKISSAMGYTIRPLIILWLIRIINPRSPKLLILPAVINAMLAFSVFFTDLVYSFNPYTNNFCSGPLKYFLFVGIFIYIAFLVYQSFNFLKNKAIHEGVVSLFLVLASLFAALFAYLGYDSVVKQTYGSCIALYYLHVYAQCTKRDHLTDLPNRRSFYSDVSKLGLAITGIVSIDMNELKWINDHKGHESGDRALSSIADVFKKYSSPSFQIYRVGATNLWLCASVRPKTNSRP